MPKISLPRFLLTLSVLFLSCLSVHGQDLILQSLDQVLLFAKENAPEQQIRNWQKEHEQYVPSISSAELFPSLRAYGTWDNYLQLPVQLLPSEAVGGEPGTFTEIRFGTQFQASLGLEASLPLFDPELWRRVKSDRLRARMNLQELYSQEQAWTEEIARTYFQLLLHEESLKLADTRFHLSDSIYRLSELIYEEGEMEPLPFQRIKSSALAAKQALIRQQKQADLVKSSLLSLIGAGDKQIRFSGKIQDLITQAEFSTYELTSLPDWKRSELTVELNKQIWKQNRAGLLPKLNATGRFYQQTLANQFSLRDASSFEVGVVGLSLNWNLFQGNLKRLKTKTAYLDWQIAKERQKLTQQMLTQEQQNLETELGKSQQLVNEFGKLLQLFEENYRLAGIQWAEGQLNADELLQVEREWIEQQQEYLIALADLFTSQALLAIRNQTYSENP